MLCTLCQKFTEDILNCDFPTWRKVNDAGLHTFRHANSYEMQASAIAGCSVCSLMTTERNRRMPGYSELGEKWLTKWSSIDLVWSEDVRRVATFKLVTVAPEQRSLEFEFFTLEDASTSETDRSDRMPHLPGSVSSKPMEAIALAKRWLHKCDTLHGPENGCGTDLSERLPTRLVDVGSSENSVAPRLHISAPDECGQYVTLSHCWGHTERLVTNDANIEQHTKGIPTATLPATFRDAITVTRLLDFRYLWIDALCIIQNSEQDWRNEAERMHHTFANASLSISALDAADSHAGFLNERHQEHVEITFGSSVVGVRPKAMSGTHGITTSLLDTRAWCLQERLLPSRVLYFGREQLYWRCRASQASETTRELITQGPTYRPQALKLVFEPDPEIRQDAWLDVLTSYSERLVTVPKDRVPALQGLGSMAVQTSSSFWIWYGMPFEGIIKSLLWRRTPWHVKVAPAFHQSSMRRTSSFRTKLLQQAAQTHFNEDHAPSWSWACLNKPVNWNWRYTLADRAPCDLDPSIRVQNQFAKRLAELYIASDSSHERKRLDWQLSLIGYVRRGTCKIIQEPDTGNDSAIFTLPPSFRGRATELSCILDHPPSFASTTCYALYITCYTADVPASISRTSTGLSTTSTGSSKSKRKSQPSALIDQAFVMLLERTEEVQANDPLTFRRIGLGQGAASEVQRMFKDTPRTSLVIW